MLLRAGISRHALRVAVAQGVVLREQSCYWLPGASKEVVLAAVFRAHATCVTALQEWAVPLIPSPPPGVHLAVPRDRGITSRDPRLRRGVVVHRSGAMAGVPEVDAAHVLADAARCLEPTTVVVAADDMLRRGLVRVDDLIGVTPRMTRWLRRVADPLAGSPPESLARLALLRAGYRVRTQVRFDGVGAVDIVAADAIVLEIDGRAYHSDPAAFVNDRRRDRALTALGYRVLRFAAAEVIADPTVVVREVRRLVGESAPDGERLDTL